MKSILPDQYAVEKQFNSRVDNFFAKYEISKKLRRCNFRKQRVLAVWKFLSSFFCLYLVARTSIVHCNPKLTPGMPQKDTIYRFLNSCQYNWRKFLLTLSSTIIKETIEPLKPHSWKNVLILDDSLNSRNRSKAVELLARVRDHVEHKYVLGFRMLTLGWSDGNTFLPVAFSLLSSENEHNRLCGINQRLE